MADLGRLTLGALAAGGRRTYAVTATLPSGANDNALQGARLSLRFTWLAESTATATEPTPDPPVSPPVAPPVTPGPTTTITGDPNATVTAEKLISMQAAKKCVSGRKLAVKFTPPAGVNVKSTATTVNGKKGASGKGAKALTLRALPKKGAVKVSVTATLSTGRKVTLKRTFKTCGK